jgi:hypothetical protein
MTIRDVTASYRDIAGLREAELRVLGRRIFRIGTLRLLVVLLALVAAVFLRDSVPLTLAAGALAASVFLFLMKVHDRLFRAKNRAEAERRYAEGELRGLDYDFSAFDGAEERIDRRHRFASDLDLFGKNSLFQSLNRTVTSFGKDVLAETFLSPPEHGATILRRQQAVAELCGKREFVLRFIVEGEAAGRDESTAADFSFSFDSRLMKAASAVVPLLWCAMVPAMACGLVSVAFGGALWTLGFLLSLVPAKRAAAAAKLMRGKTGMLEKYAALMRIAENETFASDELRALSEALSEGLREGLREGGNGCGASKAVARLKYHCHCLDQSFTLTGLMLFNPVLLWNVRALTNISQWTREHGNRIESWFAALAELDALVSLSVFAFNHPEYPYPEIADSYTFSAKSLGHPLLHRDKCVGNDLRMERQPFFFVITGANMAGKSTWLRTIGVNHILACTGAPVCAERMTFFPCTLATSLGTKDSLNENESYFFAELKRLKMIIDRLRNGETMLIVLDEILKGTNSVDKQKGSLALLEKLIDMNANGIIATHDLVLGTLESAFPDNVENCCFEAQIAGGELSFDYKLRKGIAKNMNATFLMQQILEIKN